MKKTIGANTKTTEWIHTKLSTISLLLISHLQVSVFLHLWNISTCSGWVWTFAAKVSRIWFMHNSTCIRGCSNNVFWEFFSSHVKVSTTKWCRFSWRCSLYSRHPLVFSTVFFFFRFKGNVLMILYWRKNEILCNSMHRNIIPEWMHYLPVQTFTEWQSTTHL